MREAGGGGVRVVRRPTPHGDRSPRGPWACAAAVSRGSRVDGGAPLLSPVVLLGGPAHDDATVKFLVMSALRRDEEERRRKQEEEELKALEVKLATKEQQLQQEVESRRGSSDFSPLEYAAVRWCVIKRQLEHRVAKRKRKKRRRRRRRRPRMRCWSCCSP